MSLKEASNIILNKALAVQHDESVLIITDRNLKSIGESLHQSAREITPNVDIFEIPIPEVNGQEPPKDVSDIMRNYDVILMPTTKSLSWTKARIDATEAGSRIASMPGITEDIMKRALMVDYAQMKERTLKIIEALNKANKMHITTKLGTDATLLINDQEIHGKKAGIYDKEGYWGNIPSGEAFFAPVHESTNGIFVIDASFAGIGKLSSPITIHVKDGYVIKVEGKEQADELNNMLAKVGKDAFNIAELGIGTNDKAKVIGKILEDEKVFGTAHIALGSNIGFGGIVDVHIHVDGVFTKPTIILDDEITLMEKGRFLL